MKGGRIGASGPAGAGGGAGIPARVTNWGGSGGGLPGLPGTAAAKPGGLADQYGNPLPVGAGTAPLSVPPAAGGRAGQAFNAGKTALKSVTPGRMAAGAAGAGLAAALYEIPEMFDELHDIERDQNLSSLERGGAKGGAAGDAAGSITGAAAGTAIGGAAAGDSKSAAQLSEAVHNRSAAARGASGLYSAGLFPVYPALPDMPGGVQNSYTNNTVYSANDLIITPQGQFSAHHDDYIIAMKNQASLLTAGITMADNRSQTFQGAPGIARYSTNTANTKNVNDLTVTPRGQFSAHPDDYIMAMKNPASLLTAGITMADNRSQTFQGAPGIVQYSMNTANTQNVNDHNHPAPVSNSIRDEIRPVERLPQAAPPAAAEGTIELKSELVIDGKGCRLRQLVSKNTAPCKFAAGSAKNAGLIQ